METVRAVIPVVLKITIALIMVSMGLQIRCGALLELWRRPRVLVGCLAAAFVAVPLVTFLVFRLIPLPPAARVGLWVIAITPGAPMIYRSAARRRLSDPDLAASFQVSVGLLVILFAPLWLVVASLLSGSRYWIDPLAVARQVSEVQLVPIAVGLVIGRLVPGFAERIGKIIMSVGFLVLVLLVVVILVVISPHIISKVQAREVVATLLVALSAVAGGHYLAGPSLRSRVTIANANAQRNPGLALAIVAWNLPELRPAALLVIIMYALVAVLIAAVYTKIVVSRHPAT